MIKIYKNKDSQLECHVNVGGYDFKFQIDKDTPFSSVYLGTELPEYNKFEENIDVNDEILSGIQDVMYEITKFVNWEVLFEDTEED